MSLTSQPCIGWRHRAQTKKALARETRISQGGQSWPTGRAATLCALRFGYQRVLRWPLFAGETLRLPTAASEHTIRKSSPGRHHWPRLKNNGCGYPPGVSQTSSSLSMRTVAETLTSLVSHQTQNATLCVRLFVAVSLRNHVFSHRNPMPLSLATCSKSRRWR